MEDDVKAAVMMVALLGAAFSMAFLDVVLWTIIVTPLHYVTVSFDPMVPFEAALIFPAIAVILLAASVKYIRELVS